jgi:hypothetical protein
LVQPGYGEQMPIASRLARAVSLMPWYVPVLAGATAWTNWVDSTVHPLAGTRGLAVAVGGSLVLLLVIWLAMRDVRRAGLVAFGILVLLLSKGVGAFISAVYARFELMPAVAVAVVVGLALLLAIRIGWKLLRRTDLLVIHARMNVVAAMLIVIMTGTFFASGRMALAAYDLGHDRAPPTSPADQNLPDIFFIMLDGYPRADVLAARLAYDNSAFLDALEERGFQVAPASHSPYMWTHLSVPAMLNMEYVEQIPYFQEILDGERSLHLGVRLSINDSRVVAAAHEHGYLTVAMSSGYEQLAMREADEWIDDPYMSEFELRLLESTFLSDVLNVVAPDFGSGQHRDRIRHELAVLPTVAAERTDRPQLVFVHIPAPHQPAVFGPDGQPSVVPITADFYGDSSVEREIPVDEFITDFTGQLEYLNRLVLDAIDGIVADSTVQPIIILASDHGSASRTNWRATTLADEDPAAVLERTGTFFAALTPGHTAVFPDDIGPTEIFRDLFNAYLGTHYPRAERPENGIEIPVVNADVLANSK